jgi:chemotaxis protein methyltransferase CheR
MNRNLTDSELSQVCEAIADRMGLHFPVERWAILGRNLALAAREFGFQNMNGFIQWLLSSELNKDQIKILASHLTVSETYFLREPQVFSALTDFVLPELIKSKKKRDRSIRIWSAGCSTGEEPYSLAVMLHKTIPEIKDWNINILASDINSKALDKAATGIYGPWSFRNTPEWFKSRYFHDLGDRRFEIIPEIKNMVTFSCRSLIDDDIFSAIKDKMDIIFCRNVLMYFTSEWINKISQNLFHSLTENGWFVVSSSELSSHVFPMYAPVNFPGAVLYRKTKKEYIQPFDFSLIEIPEPLKQPFQLLSFVPCIDEDLQQLSSKALAEESLQPLSSDFVGRSPLHRTQSEALSLTPQSFSDGAAKEDHKSRGKTPEDSYSDKIFAIRLLANQGYLSEALSLCNKAIASEKLAPGFYFMRASILQEMDKSSEAITSLKQGIYIDPDYVMGHFILGNLFIRQGNSKNAKRYFKNVLDLLNGRANDDILPESDGLSVKYIREIIFANMQTHE